MIFVRNLIYNAVLEFMVASIFKKSFPKNGKILSKNIGPSGQGKRKFNEKHS